MRSNATKAAIYLTLGLIAIFILVATIDNPPRDADGRAILSAGMIVIMVTSFLLTMLAIFLGFPALGRAISEHRLSNPAAVVARWRIGGEEWARFRALDQARARQFPTFRNRLDSDAPGSQDGIEVIVGRSDVALGRSCCAIQGGLSSCRFIDVIWLDAEPAALEFAFLQAAGKNSHVLRVARVPVAADAELEARRALAFHQAATDPEFRALTMAQYEEHFLARDVSPARGHVARRARVVTDGAWMVIVFALVAAGVGIMLLFTEEAPRYIARWLIIGGGAAALAAIVIAFLFRERD